MSSPATYFDSTLPWASSAADNKRFLTLNVIILVITLVLAVLIRSTDLPEVPRALKEELPPQLARLIKAKTPEKAPAKIIPPAPPEPVIAPEVEKLPEPQPQPPKPVPVAKPVIKPLPKQVSEQEQLAKARDTAATKGVLAFADQLASMRETTNLSNLADTQQTTGGGQQQKTERKLLGRQVSSTSGGINTGSLSSDIGAAGNLEGRRNTEFVAAEVGEASIATQRIEEESQVIGSRDLDSIRQVLDANKGAVYSLYRRALRQDPTIQGKLTVRLVIAANGSLLSVSLVDSELASPELVQRLIARIGLINFGAQNVTQTELEYAFNFLPF